ncbi:RNA recognition motif containing protein [Phlyctema vagabunda]|uniref:RNA recognition motif containing protein n=1 Tax=Phlyctema vagabunda TaxID=108571 RepID=A0ABR4P353_9HELO
MAPKKKEQQKMSLGEFLHDEKMGSWADEMEDMPVSDSRTGYGGGERRTYSATTGTYGNSSMGGYSVREELPLPDKPPYTVHLGNLSFDATVGDVTDFFNGCECINVRIIEDKMEMKPKGFGYAEFGSLDGLKQALTLNQSQFQGRNIRISVADPPKDRDRPDAREITDWSRKGPLPDLPGRGGNDRRPSDRGGFGSGRTFGDAPGSEYGGERRERRDPFPEGDGKVRDFGNWERKGPLSPLPQQERSTAPREGGRPRSNDGPKGEFKDRRSSPAAWGEGRPQGDSQDGSRPPRREFQERPAVERTPTAAEQDSQWRTKMRPDAPASKSPAPSRDGSEAPTSPPPGPAVAPAGRPKLNLAKRTVSEAPLASPSSSGDAKASPFGAARPIDTAAKEREIEEKRLAAIREKKEADDKAREEKKEAAKAAKAVEAEKQESGAEGKVEVPEVAEAEALKEGETVESEDANGKIVDDKAVKPKEVVRDAKPRPVESGAWRRASSGPPREDATRGARGRGDGAPRGARGGRGGVRGGRENGPASPRTQGPPSPAEPETAAMEEDGWSTVSKPKKNQRGGNNQAGRAIAS